MTFTECAGGQDRDTAASEVRPNEAPIKTENCYSIGEPFAYNQCGTSADTACNSYTILAGDGIAGRPRQQDGSSSECMPDDYGGYCKWGDIKFTSHGGNTPLVRLTDATLLTRYETSRGNRRSREEADVSRTISDVVRAERNHSRQASILNRDLTASPADTASGSLSTTMIVVISILSVFSMGLLFFFIWRNRKAIFGSGKPKTKLKPVTRLSV